MRSSIAWVASTDESLRAFSRRATSSSEQIMQVVRHELPFHCLKIAPPAWRSSLMLPDHERRGVAALPARTTAPCPSPGYVRRDTRAAQGRASPRAGVEPGRRGGEEIERRIAEPPRHLLDGNDQRRCDTPCSRRSTGIEHAGKPQVAPCPSSWASVRMARRCAHVVHRARRGCTPGTVVAQRRAVRLVGAHGRVDPVLREEPVDDLAGPLEAAVGLDDDRPASSHVDEARLVRDRRHAIVVLQPVEAEQAPCPSAGSSTAHRSARWQRRRAPARWRPVPRWRGCGTRSRSR